MSLSEPLYRASFTQAIYRYLAKYFRFSGFASRSEFWWVVLAVSLLFFLFGTFETSLGYGDVRPTSRIIAYLLAIPSLSLFWRRLHDVGLSGFWILVFPSPSSASSHFSHDLSANQPRGSQIRVD